MQISQKCFTGISSNMFLHFFEISSTNKEYFTNISENIIGFLDIMQQRSAGGRGLCELHII